MRHADSTLRNAHFSPGPQISSPVPILTIVAVQERYLGSHPLPNLLGERGKGGPPGHRRIPESAIRAAHRADRPQIAWPVAAAPDMIDRRCRFAAHLAKALISLDRLLDRLRRRNRDPQRPSPAQGVPENLTERHLLIVLQDPPQLKSGSELAHESRDLPAAFRTIRRAQRFAALAAIWTSGRV